MKLTKRVLPWHVEPDLEVALFSVRLGNEARMRKPERRTEAGKKTVGK